MENFPKCQICHQHFTMKGPGPYLLPCLHNVCEVCLKQAGGVLSCPICKTEVNLTDTHLQKDVVRQREIFHLTVQHRHSELLCTHEDDGNQAVCWCQECEEFLCEHCQNMHENFKANKMHKFNDIGDIEPGPTEEYCSIHKTYPIWLWDKKCNAAICAMCWREDHAAHDVEDIQLTYQSVKTEVEVQKKEILLAADQLRLLAEEARDQLRYSEKSCSTYTDEISHVISTVTGHLGQLEKVAIIELEKITNTKKSEFEAKCKSSEAAYQKSKFISEYISKALVYVSSTELIALKTSLRKMTESCRNLHATEVQNDVSDRCDDILDKLKRDVSSVVNLKAQGCDVGCKKDNQKDTSTQTTSQKVTTGSERSSTVTTVNKTKHKDEQMVRPVIKYSTLVIFLSVLCVTSGIAFQQTMKIKHLQTEAKEAVKEIKHLETSLQKVITEKKESIKEIKHLETSLQEVTTEKIESIKEIKHLETSLQEVTTEKKESLKEIKHLETSLQKVTTDKKESIKELNHLKTSLEKVTIKQKQTIKNHHEIKRTVMLYKQMLSILGILDDGTLHLLTSGTTSIVLQCIHLEYDRQRVNLNLLHINTDGYLMNQPGTNPDVHSQGRFVMYRGTSSIFHLPQTGSSLYWEVRASVRIDEHLSPSVSILETGLCREENRDASYMIPSRPYTYKLTVNHCIKHDSICRVTWRDSNLVDEHPDTLPNTPGSQVHLHYGVLFDNSRSKVAFIDLNEDKILSVFDDIDSNKPLWPMFGVYNPQRTNVQMKLIVGKDIEMSEKKKSLIIKALS